MSPVEILIVAAYLTTLGVLAAYGCHRLHLLLLLRRHGARVAAPAGRLDPLPRVTVQLPIYNEMYVVDRLIRASCALDYPAGLLEIQVLDDSTDETSRIAAATVAEMRDRGIDIVHLRRGARQGYKAGALDHGLRRARGELVAVFDADFLPPPAFLADLVHHFAHPRVGMVQARWEHLNRDYSLLTNLESILLDGHFVIEHGARHAAGCFFNFNGTAGLWRRACIESAGGWRSDTLTEDLDLSYRAQLKGWQFVFAPEVVAPAELPADIRGLKSQQRRWARGSIETAIRILPGLLKARIPASVKMEGLIHLTNNSSYVLMVLLAALIVPSLIIRHGAGPLALLMVDLPLFIASTVSVSAFYLRSQSALGRSRRSTCLLLPPLLALGIGLSLNNAVGVVAALAGRRGEFVRTPKHDLRGRRGAWRGSRYAARRGVLAASVETLCGLYFAGAALHALERGHLASLPFLLLFMTGFLGIGVPGLLGIVRDRPARSTAPRPRKALTGAPARRT